MATINSSTELFPSSTVYSEYFIEGSINCCFNRFPHAPENKVFLTLSQNLSSLEEDVKKEGTPLQNIITIFCHYLFKHKNNLPDTDIGKEWVPGRTGMGANGELLGAGKFLDQAGRDFPNLKEIKSVWIETYDHSQIDNMEMIARKVVMTCKRKEGNSSFDRSAFVSIKDNTPFIINRDF